MGSPEARDVGSPLVSVVIGTLNGADRLPTALQALASQRAAPHFEVVVVDDGSKDATSSVAASLGATVITLPSNQGKPHALNVGIEASGGEVVALMDDDCVPPDTWLAHVVDAWARVPDRVTMVGGPVAPASTDTLNRRYVACREPLVPQELDLDDRAGVGARLRHAFAPGTPPREQRAVYFVVGANMSVRRSAFLEVGGFDETPGIGGEEENLAQRLRARFGPHTVQYIPEMLMRHEFAPDVRDTLRRSRTYGRAYGRRWAKSGGTPTIRPVPFAVVAVALVAAVAGPLAALVAAALSPLVLYRRWVRGVRGQSGPEALIYPYVELAEDVTGNVGFLAGWASAVRDRQTAG